MENSIVQKLLQARGLVVWISMGGNEPVLAGIHLIDETFQTVALINGRAAAP